MFELLKGCSDNSLDVREHQYQSGVAAIYVEGTGRMTGDNVLSALCHIYILSSEGLSELVGVVVQLLEVALILRFKIHVRASGLISELL
jgi:hypothetical protein